MDIDSKSLGEIGGHKNLTLTNHRFFFSGLDGFDVRKIDDIEYTVEISCYFLTKWRDDRLILHEDIRALREANNGSLPEETWFPIDLEFVSKVRKIVNKHLILLF